MSENITKKSIYECTKCGKFFDTKAEAEAHYAKSHENEEKYLGKYFIMGQTPSIVGRVTAVSDGNIRTDVFVLGSIRERLNPVADIFKMCSNTNIWYTAEEFEKGAKIVSPDIVKSHLDSYFLDLIYTSPSRIFPFAREGTFISSLLKDLECKTAGGGDGN